MATIRETKTTQVIDDPTLVDTVPTSTVVTTPVQVVGTTNLLAYRVNQIIWFVFGVIEILLLLRIIFYLLGARTSPFVSFIYDITTPFVYPFQGIFPSPAASGSYFDSAAVVAVLIWALVAWGITSLVNLIIGEEV